MPNQRTELAPPAAACAVRTQPTLIKRVYKVAARSIGIWRKDGALAMLQHLRVVFLYQLHAMFLDRLAFRREPASASRYAALEDLTITGVHLADAVDYEPTPHLVLQWTMELLPKDFPNWTFIDVGAGRGRVMATAARHAFRRVLGIEIAAELRRDARRYLASLPDGLVKSDDVAVIDADAATFDRPAGPCVFFLYNPFNERVLRKFIRNLVESNGRRSDPILFAYYHPKQSHVMSEFPEIRKLQLPLKTRMRSALLSPFGLELYEMGGDAYANPDA